MKDDVAADLTQLQKAVCERMFLIFQGDTQKIAITPGAPSETVANYRSSQGFPTWRVQTPERRTHTNV
jgi:hypothetical protein